MDTFRIPLAPATGLNVNFIKGLRPSPDGHFYEVADRGETNYLRVRVTPRAKKFYMSARWSKGAASATSRMLGEVSETETSLPGFLSLAQARAKAREWEQIRRSGIDPREKERRDREAEKRAISEAEAEAAAAPQRTFAALAEAYLKKECTNHRQQRTTERAIRVNLLDMRRNPWMGNDACEVDDADIAGVIATIRDRPAPSQALHVLNHVRQIFSFAMRPENRKVYRMKAHPIAHLRPKAFGLAKSVRDVTLDDLQTVAYWRAAEALGYPDGSFYLMLITTASRRIEMGNARWPEIDITNALFTVPKERFKSKTAHLVPLSDLALETLAQLPRFDGEGSGDFLFSHVKGAKPFNSYSKGKVKLDELMLVELRKMAEARGDDPDSVTLKAFTNHDVRRVVRTGFSRLGIPDKIAELAIGHGKKGLARVYDQHKYLDEIRTAFQSWADYLRALLEEEPGNLRRG